MGRWRGVEMFGDGRLRWPNCAFNDPSMRCRPAVIYDAHDRALLRLMCLREFGAVFPVNSLF